MKDKVYFFTKRIMDLVSIAILTFLLMPVFVATAIAIKLESDGPVFADIPLRVGQYNHPFRLYKFRSMIVNAHQLLHTDPRFADLKKKYQKGSYKLAIGEDPRITKVGRFIRKSSIDELPQFINVLKGEMSLVGPRAYYPDELADQQRNYPEKKKIVKDVLTAKPGITGLWQVSGRSQIGFDKRIELDAYYAKKKSILLDIKIILMTPWAVISSKGAV
ncbi:MAG: sugar transferase [Patescibacteria group bacterium]